MSKIESLALLMGMSSNNDYSKMKNLPTLNGETIVGDKTSADLGIIDKTVDDLENYYTKTDVESKLAIVFRYKGSVQTYVQLPSSGQVVGDVYNVLEADSTHHIEAGDNVCWNGTEWDRLGGDVDLSSYYTKTETDNKITELQEYVDDNTRKINLHDYYDSTNKKIDIKTLFEDIKEIYDITEDPSETTYLDPIQIYNQGTTYLDNSNILYNSALGSLQVYYSYVSGKASWSKWMLQATIVERQQVYYLNCSDLAAEEPTYTITKGIPEAPNNKIYATKKGYYDSTFLSQFGVELLDTLFSGKTVYIISSYNQNQDSLVQQGIYFIASYTKTVVSDTETTGTITIGNLVNIPSFSRYNGVASLKFSKNQSSYNYTITTSGTTRSVSYSSYSTGANYVELNTLVTNTDGSSNSPTFYTPVTTSNPVSKGYFDYYSSNALNIIGHVDSVEDLPKAFTNTSTEESPMISTSEWPGIFYNDNSAASIASYRPNDVKYAVGGYVRGDSKYLSISTNFPELIDGIAFVKLDSSSFYYGKAIHVKYDPNKPVYVFPNVYNNVKVTSDATGTCSGEILPTNSYSLITEDCWVPIGVQTNSSASSMYTISVAGNLPIPLPLKQFTGTEFFWNNISKTVVTAYKTVKSTNYNPNLIYGENDPILYFPLGSPLSLAINTTTRTSIPVGFMFTVGENNDTYRLTSNLTWERFNLNKISEATTQQIQNLFNSNQGGE